MKTIIACSQFVFVLLGVGQMTYASDISFLDQYKNISFEQTGDGNTLNLNGTFYSADLNSSVANAYSSVSLVFPGPGSPVTLANSAGSPTDYHYQTSLLADQSTMDAAYPFGIYSYSADADSASYNYSADDYPQSNPYLTGSDYSNLQGINASQGFTFHLNPMITGGSATFSFIFFDLFDDTAGGTDVLSQGFLPSSTTTITMPAGTLLPGHTYTYQLDYSNRDDLASPGATFDAELGFDTRTTGDFTTAAAATPEPGTFTLMAAGGLLALLLLRYRRLMLNL